MTTDTREKIVAYLEHHKQASPNDLQKHLGIGAPALFRQLKKLLEQGAIAKIGQPPKVFYFLPVIKLVNGREELNPTTTKIIENHFYTVSVIGEIEEGVNGFANWCRKQKLPFVKTADEYVQTLKKYNSYRVGNLIDGMQKLKSTFSEIYLDDIFYLDFYSIERFGKTKLGTLLLYAKQGQNSILTNQIFEIITPRIFDVIQQKRIEAVGFVPPTIRRKVQFQKELEKSLNLKIPILKISKISGSIVVAQKTLNKLVDRVENAAGTIFVEQVPLVKTVLLIDDAVGSGASLNETARKIKERQPGVRVIGLAVTGSFNGFDVLNEV